MDRQAEDSVSMQLATLHLKRGLSAQVDWILPSAGGPSITTIGASRICDWQIHASGVASHALSIAVVDGALHAAAAPDACVMLNGCPLSETWHQVNGPAVIRFGEAQLDLHWGNQGLSAKETEQVAWPDAESQRTARQSLIGDARLPSLLETGAKPSSSASMLRIAGIALFAALSYFAWLVILDHM
jgi:hypothetical protein